MNNHRHSFIKNLLSKTTPTTKQTPKQSPSNDNPFFQHKIQLETRDNIFEVEREPQFYNQRTPKLPYGSMPTHNSLRQALTPPSKITPDKFNSYMDTQYRQENEVTRITKS